MTSSVDRMTVEEMTESLTGFEEIAIKTHFGFDIGSPDGTSGTTFLRGLIFAHLARAGQNAKDAKAGAMGLTIKAAADYFADDDEVTPDEPATEPGKDDEPHD